MRTYGRRLTRSSSGWDGDGGFYFVERSFGTANAVSYRMGSPRNPCDAEFACDKKKKPGGQSSSGQFVASALAHTYAHTCTWTRTRAHTHVPAPLSRRKAIWKSEPARDRAQFPERLGLGNTAAVRPVFLSRGVRKKRRLKINVRRLELRRANVSCGVRIMSWRGTPSK